MHYRASDELAMGVLAQAVAQALRPGDAVLLIGDLGTGKTTLSKGIGKALGIDGHMASPSYTIVNAYTCKLGPLYHADVYRLNSVEELDDIGFFDYLHENGLVLVEWADKIYSALVYETQQIITLRLQALEVGRSIEITGYGDFEVRLQQILEGGGTQ